MNIEGVYDSDVIHWWYAVTGKPSPKLTVLLGDLISYYLEEGSSERIRGDVALIQAIKETGWFQFGGRVPWTANNFCGLGATNSTVTYAVFPSARLGVRAHIQHLCAYLGRYPKTDIIDPRFQLVYGDPARRATTWEGLSGKWAVPGTTYGQDIVRMWGDMRAGR